MGCYLTENTVLIDESAGGYKSTQQVQRKLNLLSKCVSWSFFAFLLCFFFGLFLILNTLNAGDGGWFWYAWLFLQGKKIYADLHLVQQPLFVLETSLALKLLGNGWLISKVPAVLHLLAYSLCLFLLVRRSRLSDARKALLFTVAFFVSISFEAYRFDDYHVLTDCFVLFSLNIIFALQPSISVRLRTALLVVLGILSGLALTTRLNDGAALLIGVVLATWCNVQSRRMLSILIVTLAAAATVLVIVQSTGDNIHDYLTFSVLKAAGSKGGLGHVMLDPFRVPYLSVQWLSRTMNLPVLIEACGIALAVAYLLGFGPNRRDRRAITLGIVGLLLAALCLRSTISLLFGYALLNDLSGFAAILVVPLALWVLARFGRLQLRFGLPRSWNQLEILLLIPIGQFASASMSSGGYYVGLCQPLAVLMVLAPLCSPYRPKLPWQRDFLFVLSALLLISTSTRRAAHPYLWYGYHERPLFVNRIWFQHPQYGLMFLDRDLLRFIQPVCQDVGQNNSSAELLAVPFSFANYFCAVPPWRGYVQTYFDITRRQTIDELILQLQASPPKWIFYQRQLKSLQWHEVLYNHGQPLAQRDLDRVIEERIARNEWQVVYRSDFGTWSIWESDWMLIRTK